MAEYIEREAAFNAILKLVPKVDGDGYCWVIRGDAATAIDAIPAADVRPVVRGEWKPHKTKTGKNWWKCSACDYVSEHKAHHNYCPNCGADMREES